MGALIGMVALINKNTFEGGAYRKEGAKSLRYMPLEIQFQRLY